MYDPRSKQLFDCTHAELVVEIIRRVGEDPKRAGLVETPARVVNSWTELFGGYREDPKKFLKTFPADGFDEMIVVKDISYWSTCEHHMLPFTGTAAVGYLPNGRIVGLSKIPRLVRCFSRRLQVQERMTMEVALALQEAVGARGVGCVVKGLHSCMACRGVRAEGAVTVTSYLTGVFRTDPAARSEFLKFAGEV